jgi:hypothetical protein
MARRSFGNSSGVGQRNGRTREDPFGRLRVDILRRMSSAGMIGLTSVRFSRVKISGVYQPVTPPPPYFS